jgi:hypothetical protein
VSRVESDKNGQGRVQGLFLPGSAGPAPAPSVVPGSSSAPAAPPRPGPPVRPF